MLLRAKRAQPQYRTALGRQPATIERTAGAVEQPWRFRARLDEAVAVTETHGQPGERIAQPTHIRLRDDVRHRRHVAFGLQRAVGERQRRQPRRAVILLEEVGEIMTDLELAIAPQCGRERLQRTELHAREPVAREQQIVAHQEVHIVNRQPRTLDVPLARQCPGELVYASGVGHHVHLQGVREAIVPMQLALVETRP